MRIALDARALSDPPGGIRRYVESLLGLLIDTRLPIDWRILAVRGASHALLPDGVERIEAPAPFHRSSLRAVWEELALPALLRRHRVDVFFSTYGAVPRGARCPTVATIHDLFFLRRPDTLPWSHRAYWNSVARRARLATLILSPSESTRRECLALPGVRGDRVRVTPLGVAPVFRPVRMAGSGLPPAVAEPFVLAFGPWIPRKNLAVLIDATRGLADPQGRSLKLVVVGVSESPALPAHMVALGRLSDEEIAEAARRCVACCVPSLHEGFGLSALEAMACGSPLLASNAGALPELTGAAAALLEPGDSRAWREAIARLLRDGAERERLSLAGIDRSRSFTWEETARGTLQALIDAATPAGRG